AVGGGVADRVGRGVKRTGDRRLSALHARHVVRGEDDLGAHRVGGIFLCCDPCRGLPTISRMVMALCTHLIVHASLLGGLCRRLRGGGGRGLGGIGCSVVRAGGQGQGGGQGEGGEGNGALHDNAF